MSNFYLVLVISFFNEEKKYISHCLRTLNSGEVVLSVKENLKQKIESISKYRTTTSASNQPQEKPYQLLHKIRWYFKDVRTAPIEMGDAGEVLGEFTLESTIRNSSSSLERIRAGNLLDNSFGMGTGHNLADDHQLISSAAKRRDESKLRDGFEDGEVPITYSDFAYLQGKAERKGYLLKRSSRDVNLWRRYANTT